MNFDGSALTARQDLFSPLDEHGPLVRVCYCLIISTKPRRRAPDTNKKAASQGMINDNNSEPLAIGGASMAYIWSAGRPMLAIFSID